MLSKPPIRWTAVVVLLAVTALACDVGRPALTAGPPATVPSTPQATMPAALSTEEVGAAVAAGPDVVQWPRRQDTPTGNACEEGIDHLGSQPCIHGNPEATRTVVVYGDSRAGMWIPPLDAIGKQTGWRVEQIMYSSCPVPDFPVWDFTLKRRYTECDQFRAAAVDRIRGLHPDLLIIASSSTYSMEKDGKPESQEATDRAWGDGLAVMLARLKPLAGRVVMIGNIPYMAYLPLDCLTAHPDDVQRCNTDRSAAVFEVHNRMAKSVTEQGGARYVDPIPWFCTTTVCPVVIAGLDVYRNQTHVSGDYSLWLRNVLVIALGLLPATP